MRLKPGKGGFTRAFGCGWFVRECLLGKAPHGSPRVRPEVGAAQSDLFDWYKTALIQATAEDRAIRAEERLSEREGRFFDPDNIADVAEKHLKRIPRKSTGATYASFVNYFANLKRLGWVEPTGQQERSAFQDHYPAGQPRKFFRLTEKGRAASDDAWANPFRALYGPHKKNLKR